MKRLLAWITITCMFLNLVGYHVATAAGSSARDVVVRQNDAQTEEKGEEVKNEANPVSGEDDGKTSEDSGKADETGKNEKTDESGKNDEPGKTIVAGDGSSYEIQVTYRKDTGIPMDGTELAVKELLPGDKSYDSYIAQAAAKLNKTEKEVTYSRVFDISIVDAKDRSIAYDPKGNVGVSIRLLDEKLEEYDNVDVLHFKDTGRKSGLTVETMESSVDGENLEFTTDGFSVYVVIGHENGTVINPRVEFHFISEGATEFQENNIFYYKGTPYSFSNTSPHGDQQTTQILKDGEALEFIADPQNYLTKYFYGWYVVDPYVISGTTDGFGVGADGSLYYTWPLAPAKISFESGISITEQTAEIDDTVVHWTLNGVSGEGKVDADGNVHVFLAPVFENYNFVDFLLYPRGAVGSGEGTTTNLMTRKLVALGSSQSVDVKISDIRSTSTDPVHLVFTGWEYNAGTADNPNWVRCQTVDYTGAEMKDPGKDGVYLDVTADDTTNILLYPVFIQARWVDYFAGVSGSGATYVASRFRESWGNSGNPPQGMEPDPERNVFSEMVTSTRSGYLFEGWYAFAVTDPRTGEITNLTTPADVEISYIDYLDNLKLKKTTINTTAVKIANADGSIAYNGTYTIAGSSGTLDLFGTVNGDLRLYDGLDRLSLCANWTPDSSRVTVVYWTENEQGKNYVAPAPGHEKDDYTISAVKLVTTAELNAQSGTIGATFKSGSTLTLEQLKLFEDDGKLILEREYLDDVGAVDEGQEKFYDLNETLSDTSVVINGDQSTTINVYFERKTFKLVFHIGRDGYVKQNGQQRPEFMTRPAYQNWDGNWIQFMFDDDKVSSAPPDGLGYTPGPTADSYQASFTMTYMPDDDPSHNQVYTSGYVTDEYNVKGDYVPSDGEDVYVITAKYGAYIGDRWPTPVNPKFDFTYNNTKSMYIWAAYYGSYYCGLSHARKDKDNPNGSNPDINGIYEYMSAELCSSRDGSQIINENQVHHLVAYYGQTNNPGKIKHYHSYYEAIPGTYPDGTVIVDGADFSSMGQTTWSEEKGSWSLVNGHLFYKAADADVISNLAPNAQLGTDREGYELVYSCWETPQTNDHHIYFFYRQKQRTLTFNFGDTTIQDIYCYTQPLAEADKYTDLVTIPEGYYFKGWYQNAEGVGEPFDFEHETMPDDNIVLYPILRVLQYTVKIDPNGGVINHEENSSQSTYFTANYGTTVGEYTLKREFIKLTDKELNSEDPNYYTGTKYYYVNMQRLGIPEEGDWGLPTNLRNAVYVAENDIDDFYDDYSDIIDAILADPEQEAYWSGIQKMSKDDFISTYATSPFRPVENEHYTFMGWYQVTDGTVASMPFNFNDPVQGPLELRAMWRLDGGYYIQYNPYYLADDGNGNVTIVVGEVDQWTDPEQPTLQLYADQSKTNILRAPTNTTAGWIFRGWRVVKAVGKTTYDNIEYDVWEPIQVGADGQPIYYQPGDDFLVDSDLVTAQGLSGAIIHMQAYYEPEDNSYRRPKVTNLKLDANGGYLVDAGGNELTENTNLAWNEPGTILMDADVNQIQFGDFQSNTAVHLTQYAKQPKYFAHPERYLLLGFDDESDENDYIATYPADSVISVQRTDDETLYAVWEPMVYVTFVNTTDEPITVHLSGTGTTTISTVNKVTGEFDREHVTDTIDVPAKTADGDGSVTVVLPGAVPGTDSITAVATNDHVGKKMSVSGQFQTQDPYGTGSDEVAYLGSVEYTGILMTDETGVIVTYTETPERLVIFNVNGGLWNETSEDYTELEEGSRYGIKEDVITNNQYKPADPSWPEDPSGKKIFLGWTTNADIAAVTDFSSTESMTFGTGDTAVTVTPDAGGVVLDKIRSDYLWDFSQEPPYDEVLYAVWSDPVTVTFDLQRTGNKLHVWSGPETSNVDVPYVFYRENENSRYVTYTLLPGETVPKPYDPTANPDADNQWKPAERFFLAWLTVGTRKNGTNKPNDSVIKDYTFDFENAITHDITLYTSWTTSVTQTFTFNVENHVIGGGPDEVFTYNINIPVATVWGKRGTTGSSVGDSEVVWGTVPVKLKNNESYTVTVAVKYLDATGWDACSVEVCVTDSEGNIVKNSPVTYANRNSNPWFVGGYIYSIYISQEAKDGYTTTVGVDDNEPNDPDDPDNPNDYIVCETDQDTLSFWFDSKWGSTKETNPAFIGFTPSGPNAYAYTDSINSQLTVVFTNEFKPIIAPTDYHESKTPFLWMFLIGLLLCLTTFVYRCRRVTKRR